MGHLINQQSNKATRVGILALDNCYVSSLSGLVDHLHVANVHLRDQGGASKSSFNWEVISLNGQAVTSCNGLSVTPDCSINQANGFDVIYIPAVFYPSNKVFSDWLANHYLVRDWLVQQWKNRTLLAASCTSTFMLAETGLLKEHKATTTWWLERQFKNRYPLVNLQAKEMMVMDNRVLTAGAMSAYQYLAIQLIKLFSTPDIATLCARTMLVDMNQEKQAPYRIVTRRALSNDRMIAKAQRWMTDHLHEAISIQQLADRLAVTQRTLIRKFKHELELTPLQYLQNLRIDQAKQLLEATALPLTEIVEMVGYTDISSFSRLFIKHVGISPAKYRQRFRTA